MISQTGQGPIGIWLTGVVQAKTHMVIICLEALPVFQRKLNQQCGWDNRHQGLPSQPEQRFFRKEVSGRNLIERLQQTEYARGVGS